MSRFYPIVIVLGVFGLILSYQNCGRSNLQAENPWPDPSTINGRIVIQGTLEKSNIDGCKFLLRSEEGQYFIPVKLAPEYQLDGSNLIIEGSLRNDIVTTCMGGTVLQVEKVETGPVSP